MTTVKRKSRNALALFLVVATLSLYAPLSYLTPRAFAADSPAATPQAQTVGILSTTGNRNIQVNKNDASTGATIVDGAMLETSDCVSAVVRLWPIGAAQSEANEIGRVELSNNSSAVINYSANKISVTLTRGCAIVRAAQNVDGFINTPDGKSIPASQPDTLNRKRAEACYPSNTKGDFIPHCLAVPPVVFILGGAGAAAAITAVVVSSRGDNPSPAAPLVR
jgi:hypothetical protein